MKIAVTYDNGSIMHFGKTEKFKILKWRMARSFQAR